MHRFLLPRVPHRSLTSMPFQTLASKIDKPSIDDRDYRLVQLPNQLEALLIHDPTTDKSAAALDVNVGAFSDPKGLPGLAHFCEHLLFMGTEKYPSENEYSSYLSKNSGYSNAYTSSMHTNYYFEVANPALEGALDRFAQFFICPLFSPSCKDREINAVDSENKKNLENDSWRLYQLGKSLTTGRHPYFGFSTGNKITLGEVPKSEGLDVREELLKFHSSHYSANLMRLVVLSNEPLSTLTDWAVEKFSPVVDKNLSMPFWNSSPFDNENYSGKTICRAKPITEMRSLQLCFAVPDMPAAWQSLPAKYLSHLIGHESEGSILYAFKEKGWATELSAGPSTISPGFGEFQIDIELTKEGLAHYEEIIEDVFKFIKMLKNEGPQEYVFQELQDQSKASFKFRQKYGSSTTASKLSSMLHNLKYYDTPIDNPKNDLSGVPEVRSIPPNDLLSLSVVRKFEPEYITKYLSYFTPDNFLAMLIAKEPFDELTGVEHEKWYGTEYKIDPLSSSLVKTLENVALDPRFHLPQHNPFIPTNFELVSQEEPPKYPKLIEADQRNKIWYKLNPKLGGPRSSMVFKFNLPGSTSTPLNSVLLSLLMEVLDDDLNSISYLASISGLSHEFNLARDGISLQISGYSDKLSILLETLVDRLIKFTDPQYASEMWDEKRRMRFEVLREKLFKHLKNFGYSVPYNQVGPILSALINENSWLIDDQRDCEPAITFDVLRNYATNLFDVCFIEALVLGNYTKKQAKTYCDVVSSKFHKSIVLTESQFTRGRSLDLPVGEAYNFLKPNDDAHNVNSCMEVYVQLGMIPDSRGRVTAELIAQILHEPFFNRLRTNEQLGYVVFSGLRETRTTYGLRFLVQSERSTAYLQSRIHAFMLKMGTKLDAMPEEEFQKHVDAVITKKQQKVKNLREERTRFWNRIASGFYDFDRREQDIEILKSLPLSEIQQVYKDKILNPSGNGKLAVHLQSQVVPEQPKSAVVKSAISNFLYEKSEFDSFEGQTDLDQLVDKKMGLETEKSAEFNIESVLNTVLDAPEFAKLLPDFKYDTELKEYVLKELATDYSKISTDATHKLIDHIGEWKCLIPLTPAPSAKIVASYLDESKL